ncbi:hypothetical protein ACTFIY_004613, partial [Dictyostelium cf. discoideum]
KKP